MGKGINNFLFAGMAVAATASVARQILRSRRHINLRNKVVLIAGGSRGLGLVLAREFAARGARVAICARKQTELEHVREEFADAGRPLFAMACDIGIRAEVGKLLKTVRDELGEIDVLVNNAGAILVGPAVNQATESFEDVMQTNFWGPFYLTTAVLEQMKNRRSGRIVNIASIGGKIAFPHLLPYTTSKFALVGYSEGLRPELTKYNVFVTTVCPGLMRTGSPRNAEFVGQAEKEYEWFVISSSLPGISIDAKRAARHIINACIHGDAEIHLGVAAKIGAVAQGCAPGMVSELLSVVNGMMPDAPPGRPVPQKGYESETELTQTPTVRLTRNAEIANNEL